MNRSLRCFLTALLFCAVSSAAVDAADQPRSPSAKEKCAVCGMFVAGYPNWLGVIEFRDATRLYFDGPKDLVTCLLNLGTYAPTRKRADIASIRVKDYYSLAFIDGEKAFYVLGSDVLGPMGKELVPFGKRADAEGFSKDHGGKKILRLGEVTVETLRSLR